MNLSMILQVREALYLGSPLSFHKLRSGTTVSAWSKFLYYRLIRLIFFRKSPA